MLDIRQDVEVTGIKRETDGWRVDLEQGPVEMRFSGIVVTAPAPQAAALVARVAPGMTAALASVDMAPVWTLLAGFDAPLELPERPAKAGIVDKALKMPGTDGDPSEAWVIHTTPDFSRRHLEQDRVTFATGLLQTVFDAFQAEPVEASFLRAHRWRFAYAETAFGAPFLVDAGLGLWVGGDWALGRTGEAAFQSGRAMADAILSSEAKAG
jgi:predicted NAD/FAD-dependent oxidoreductase